MFGISSAGNEAIRRSSPAMSFGGLLLIREFSERIWDQEIDRGRLLFVMTKGGCLTFSKGSDHVESR